MANGDDDVRTVGLGNKLPQWAQVIAFVGIPGFLVLYLLGAVPFMKSPIDRIADLLASHAQATETLTTTVGDVKEDQRELTKRMTTAFRVFCENAAKTDEARNNCKVIDSK